MKNIRLLVISLFVFAGSVFAQSEAQLKEYFEGKTVIVKMDMPGTHQGVDVYVGKPRPVDFDNYSKRLKTYGISLRNGETTMITKIRVKDKNIEIQLGGGGYGTAGDDTNTSVNFTPAAKSRREKDLEDELKAETDTRRRREIQDELNTERRQREREDSRNRARAEQASEAKKQRIAQKRAEGGSRFNIWFEKNVPPNALSPNAIMEFLGEYLDFSGRAPVAQNNSGNQSAPENASPSGGNAILQIKKGMTRSAVDSLLGQPKKITEKNGEARIILCSYYVDDKEIQAEFVEDILIRYSISSR